MLYLACTLLVCVLVPTGSEATPALERVTVCDVLASDTVIVRTASSDDLWVTLLGVGTPETAGVPKDDYLLGKRNLNWLETWLPPGSAALMERRGETSSGRPLVLLYRVEDRFCWNAFLVRTGGAFAARQADFREFSKFASLEREAKARKVGIWVGYRSAEEEEARVAAASDHSRRASERIANTVFSPRNFTPPKRRPPYARQDWGLFDAQYNAMMAGMAAAHFGYGGGYGGYDPRKTVHVRGYYREGTYVNPYNRRPPSR